MVLDDARALHEFSEQLADIFLTDGTPAPGREEERAGLIRAGRLREGLCDIVSFLLYSSPQGRFPKQENARCGSRGR